MFSLQKQIVDEQFSDTPLHILLRTCTSVDQVKEFIKTNDKKQLLKWAKIVNNKGELPIFMIFSLPFRYQEHHELQTMLLPFTIPESYVPFGPLDEEKILNRYSHLKVEDKLTYANLELGVKAIQAARQLFTGSSTHPQVNDLSDAERNAIKKQIGDEREEYKKILENEKNKSLPEYEQPPIKALQHKVKFYTGKVANCIELSEAVLCCIYKLDNKKNADNWLIPSDDHVIDIIDAHTPHAVICDALTGDVFPASELLTKLSAFYRVFTKHSYFNCLVKFNPNYHYLQKLSSLHDSELKPDKCIAPYVFPYKSNATDDVKESHINKPILEGLTPLSFFAEKKAIARTKLLLFSQADPDILSKDGATPLNKAAENENTAAIELLLKAKANIELTNHNGETPLAAAVIKGNSEAVKILLEKKANPNHGRFDGATPLFFIRNINTKPIIKRLVESKADINYQMSSGHSPLINSIYTKDINLLQCLLDEKANPNIPDKNGLTALYLAAEFGLVDHVKLLLQYNADPHIKFKNEFIPLNIAEDLNHTQIVEILEKFEEMEISEIPKKKHKSR